jgi:hypothetical protein
VSDPLEALARRVEGDPFFLASVLSAYAGGERLDDGGLAAALGCRPADLPRLRLCRAPCETAPGFGADVDNISAHFGLDAGRLAAVVRRGQWVLRLRADAAALRPHGLLLAARDAGPADDAPAGEGP